MELKLKIDEFFGFIEIFNEKGKIVAAGIYEDNGDEIFINEFYVDIHERGKGIGTNGYKLIRDYFKKRGKKRVRLIGSEGNTRDPFNIDTPYDFWTLKCDFKKSDDGTLVDKLN